MLRGSSPRTWGTGNEGLRGGRRHRFIPTHVGNRAPSWMCLRPESVHPHARGEQRSEGGPGRRASGSSPRTWGTVTDEHRLEARARFIPTHVGNRTPTPCSTARTDGSSPRTWGTELRTGADLQQVRFIPTHVGNRRWACIAVLRMAVHPHARGEQRQVPEKGSTENGSSPRTWGTASAAVRSR